MPTQKPLELLQVDNPPMLERGVVRMLSPAVQTDSDSRQSLRSKAVRPYIVENDVERRLHFTSRDIQSAMRLDNPDVLVSDYAQKMMAFLLFNPDPKHILMIGLGGGSLAKFCYRNLPNTKITVVEIDADVIALRDQFCVPKDDERFRVVHCDGARYMEGFDENIDVLLIDAFDADGIALSLSTSVFYARAAAQLSANGVLVMNLFAQGQRYVDNIRAILAAFQKHILLVPMVSAENVLLFAISQPPPQPITRKFEFLARQLQSRLQLDFPRYLRRMCQGHLLRVPQSERCGATR